MDPLIVLFSVNVDMLCDVDIREPVQPIAYMVHTHEHGRLLPAKLILLL